MDTGRAELPLPLRSIAVERTLAAGEPLFQAAAPATAVFFLVSGAVRLVRYGPDGEEIPIHQAHAGEYFAEASLRGDRYHCTALALRPSVVLALPAGDVARLLANDPAFAGRWIETLALQLRVSRARVERLCLKRASERVRHLLLTEGSGPQHRYQPRGSLKELAWLLGLTHEALYRTLAAMERAGELARDERGLRLPRRPLAAGATPTRRGPA